MVFLKGLKSQKKLMFVLLSTKNGFSNIEYFISNPNS